MRKKDMQNIPLNEDIQMLVMSKSMPLSVIAKSIAETKESICVTIIESTADGFGCAKIGLGGTKATFQEFLFSALIAVHNIMDQINQHPQAKEVKEHIDLDKETMELAQKLFRKIEKRTKRKDIKNDIQRGKQK